MPLIFRHGPAGAAFTAAVAAWLVFEFVMRIRQRRRAGGPPATDVTYSVLVACIVAAVIAAEVLGRDGRLPWPGGLAWPAVAGVALITAGIGLRAWSIATLGRFFQYQITIQPSHQVVTTGPYRHLRHPAYTAVAFILTGVALACDDVWSLVAAAALGATGRPVAAWVLVPVWFHRSTRVRLGPLLV
jgi:protein-S-isoprenylcysteine O-methyltransferase Ste14